MSVVWSYRPGLCVLLFGFLLPEILGEGIGSFQFSSIESPRTNGTPFQATLTARACDGSILEDWNGNAWLFAKESASDSRVLVTEISFTQYTIEFTNPDSEPVDIGDWRVETYAGISWPKPAGVFLFPAGEIIPPLGVFTISIHAYYENPGTYPKYWTKGALFPPYNQLTFTEPLGVVLRNDDSEVVDLVAIQGFDPSSLNPPLSSSWSGFAVPFNRSVIPDRIYTYQRRGHIDRNSAGDWTVGVPGLGELNTVLHTPFLQPEISIPIEPTRIALENGVWTGMVKIANPSDGLILRASDGDGAAGQSESFQVLAGRVLTIDPPEELFEANAGNEAQGEISMKQTLGEDLIVALASSLPEEIDAPAMDDSGFRLAEVIQIPESDFELDRDRAFFHTGDVVNLEESAGAGQYPVAGCVVSKADLERVYYLNQIERSAVGPLMYLHAFDPDDFSQLWKWNVPYRSGLAKGMSDLGERGLAVHTGTDTDRLILVDAASFEEPAADVSVGFSAQYNDSTLGGVWTYSCVVTNAGPWTASNVILSNPIPMELDFLSANSTRGDCVLTDGVLECDFGTLLAGESEFATIQVSPMVPSNLVIEARVDTSVPDPNANNNAAGFTLEVTPPPSLSVRDVAIAERDFTTGYNLIIELSAPTRETVTVQYTTSDGTAVSGSDYESQTETAEIRPGFTSTRAPIRTIYGDRLIEPNETLHVTLSQATNAVIGVGEAVITLLNDDEHEITVLDLRFPEGDEGFTQAVFEVSLTRLEVDPSVVLDETVTVEFATVDGTAIAGEDYIPKAGHLIFSAGETRKTVCVSVIADRIKESHEIDVIGDEIKESHERMYLVLRNPEGARLLVDEAEAVIVNDDDQPELEIESISSWNNNRGMLVIFTAEPEGEYILQKKLELNSEEWTQVGSPVVATDWTAFVIDTANPVLDHAFYRAVRLR